MPFFRYCTSSFFHVHLLPLSFISLPFPPLSFHLYLAASFSPYYFPVSVFLQFLIFSLSSLPLLNSSAHSSFLIPLWLSVLPLSLHFYLLSLFPCFCISPIYCLSIILFSFTSSSQSSFLIPLWLSFLPLSLHLYLVPSFSLLSFSCFCVSPIPYLFFFFLFLSFLLSFFVLIHLNHCLSLSYSIIFLLFSSSFYSLVVLTLPPFLIFHSLFLPSLLITSFIHLRYPFSLRLIFSSPPILSFPLSTVFPSASPIYFSPFISGFNSLSTSFFLCFIFYSLAVLSFSFSFAVSYLHPLLFLLSSLVAFHFRHRFSLFY